MKDLKNKDFIENFELAYQKLFDFTNQKFYDENGITENPSERDVAGIIQAFEFTIEQAWKALQKLAKSESLEVVSPKSAFKIALQLGLIKETEEELFNDMLYDRNLTSHTYKKEVSLDVYNRIVNSHKLELGKLLERLKKF